MTRRSGFTLIELIVVIAMLGIIAGVTAVSLRSPVDPATLENAEITAASRRAIESGHPVSISVRRQQHVYAITAKPDGRVVADTALMLDPLTGVGAKHAR